LSSQALLETNRLAPQFFTRCRALPFATVLAFLLCGVRGAVQAEPDGFFALLAQRTRLLRVVTAQAFSKARHQIRADVFERVNQALLGLVREQIGFTRWQGMRLVAADASHVRLTLFDPQRRVRYIKEAVAFGLFLPGLELFERFTLHEPLCDERQMLVEHLDALAADDLLLLDRGYPSAWLVALLIDRNIPFCMRCDVESAGFNAVRRFMRSGQHEAIVSLPAPGIREATDYECPRHPPRVRLIRQVTPQGKVRVLMTSLFDAERFPVEASAQLYHQRWRIEEAFKRIKHRLNLEHTSGLSWLAARQDFGAKAVCDNLSALAAWCAAERHLEPDSAWRINRSLAFNTLRRILPRALVTATLSPRILAEVLSQIALNLQKFVPERHRPRTPRDKPHKFHAYKPAV
jgi:hypothetical protein